MNQKAKTYTAPYRAEANLIVNNTLHISEMIMDPYPSNSTKPETPNSSAFNKQVNARFKPSTSALNGSVTFET